MLFIEIFTTIILGLMLGSFSTALIYRVPKRLSWWGAERSACPACKTTLGVFDLIPILSWCLSMGKCRHCSARISWRYPLIELVSALACLGIYIVFGFSVESLFMVLCVPFLMALFVIDLKHMILPNQLVFILMILGLLRLCYLSVSSDFIQLSDLLTPYILGAVAYAFVPWSLGIIVTKILKKESLGFGDVKFFFVSGLWLGIYSLQYFMILSGGLAILFALCWKMIVKQDVFPFGPALIVSFYSLLLFQGSILP